MRFYKRPFLFITPILVIGIFFGIIFPSLGGWVMFLSVCLLVSMALHFADFKKIFQYTLLLSFVGLGGLIWNLTNNHSSTASFNGDFVVEVLEQPVNSKDWKKGIGKIRLIENGDSFEKADQKILFFATTDFQAGDVLLVHSNVNPIENKNNPGEFDAESFWGNKGIRHITFIGDNSFRFLGRIEPSWFAQTSESIRSSITQFNIQMLGTTNGGVLNAILLGDKSNLSLETTRSFSNAGAMHVLAVSGLHVGIILLIFVFVFGRLKFLSRTHVYVISISCIWLYALITGFSPSVVRASLMFSILVGAQLSSRKSDSLNTLFLSALILLVIDPNYLFDIGFQLSYLAVLGILLINPSLTKLFYIKNKWLRKIWEGSAVGISAQVFTIPLSLYYFHQFPNYFVLSNVGVMIFAGVILTFGLIFIATKELSFLSGVLKVAMGLILNALLFFIQFVESLPGSVAVGFELSPYLVVVMYLILLSCVFFYRQKWTFRLSILSLVLMIVFIQSNRYLQMNESHLLVFNHNKPLIVWKDKTKIICFHQENDGHYQQILDGYLKVYPGEVKSTIIQKEKESIAKNGESKVQVRQQEDGVIIRKGKETILLKTNYNQPQYSYDKIYYLPYLKNGEGDANLSNGAIILIN